ncbi:MAG: LysM peptidoglycan-binding domain-containing protein [Verrucomicrobiota bacterium]
MNNPSPFNPQSPESSPVEQKNQNRVRVRTAVTLVFIANFIALMALLLIGFGCRKPAEPEPLPVETNTMTMPEFDTNAVPPMDTNIVNSATNAYVPPAQLQPVVETPAPTTQEYTIAKGDYFEKIAKEHGVTTKAIQEANPGVDSKKLKIGQKIQIPAAGAAPAPNTVTPSVVDGGSAEQIYKVKSNDTLTTIAKHFGVSVKALRSANSLTTDKIKVGDKLKIPAKSTPAPVVTEPAPVVPAAPSAAAPKPI